MVTKNFGSTGDRLKQIERYRTAGLANRALIGLTQNSA